MFVLIALFVFALAFVATPTVIALAWRIGAVDVPQDGRRMHRERIPRSGGIAIMLPVILGCFLAGEVSHFLLCALCGAGLMLAVGLADDMFCLGAWTKLLFQSAAAVAAVLGSGIAEGSAAVFAVIWVVILTNAHNFIDGMDGLLAGCATIEAGLLAVVHLLLGNADTAQAALFLVLACLAFRLFNRYPAQVFAGDCGSESVGFLLGMLSLPLFAAPTLSIGNLSPLFIFAYPLIDLFSSILRRLLHGRSPFAADRAHLHHRIYASGASQPECCAVLMSATVSLGTVGVLLISEALWAYASVACVVAALVLLRIRSYIVRNTV
ncbi:MAG: undecaprenyl/decaprenyl-phosphate alpha-N-acetylglucosaminyl 1-phosphate transferase [Clostridia bacterium]|nr:undecaprenyl/decaprenyl-phosphate alpha-N-acetylglucosaminyl 1-phosphate transferase [Clostridia bacterium]